jgi:gliding motility-associated lipoprotein GldD
VNNRKGFDKLVSDAFTLTDKHNVKANSRRESQIKNEHGVAGLLFEVDGPVASPIQFYLTDSTHHFFRASLYLNATVNPDSTSPIFQYLRSDMEKIIESFKWKK